MQPLITIGIPAYNCEKKIERAILSAQKQTYNNLEIIVIDDGSDDNTWQLISNFNDKRLRCLRFETNRGAAVARNTIIKEAQGEYIAFFDADDESHISRVVTQYNGLVTHQKKEKNKLLISLCSFNRIYLDDRKEFVQSPGYHTLLSGKEYALNEISLIASTSIGQKFVKHLFRVYNDLYFKGTSILLAPKNVFHEIGYYDEIFRRCQDTDWNIRFGLAGGRCVGTKGALVDYYVTSANYKAHAECNRYHYYLFKKHKASFCKLRCYDQIMQTFLFNQKLLIKDFSWLNMLLKYPFNIIPLLRFLKSYILSSYTRGRKIIF